VANLGLFGKNLSKISTVTVNRFGSIAAVGDFLETVAGCGSVSRAVEIINSSHNVNSCSNDISNDNNSNNNANSTISPLHVQRLINDDRYLAKCVAMAKQVAVERAESVLYERAINGYEEITYGRDGAPLQVKRKYCAKSLMEYLKANSSKYCGGKVSVAGNKDAETELEQAGDIDIGKIEVESYADYGKA